VVVECMGERSMSNLPMLYLTGSHYFGTQRPDSDVDIFAEASAELVNILKVEGFVPEQVGGQYNTLATWRNQHGVHVQLVKNAPLKAKIQEVMLKLGLGEALRDKVLATKVWTLMYEVAGV